MTRGGRNGTAFVWACGGAVALWAALFLFGLRPRLQTLAREERLLAMPDLEGIAGPRDVQAWRDHREGMEKKIVEIARFYAALSGDLEEWLDVEKDPSGVPLLGPFFARLQTEQAALHQAVQVRSDSPAEGFCWEKVDSADLTQAGIRAETVPQILKDLQKMFWVRKRLAASLQEAARGNRESVVLEEVRWFKPITARRYGLVLGQGREPPLGEAEMLKIYTPQANQREEVVFPGGLGKTITFGATLRMPLREVPSLLSSLLARDPPTRDAPRLPLEIVSLRIDLTAGRRESILKKVPEGSDLGRARVQEYAGLQAPPVVVRLGARIYDYDEKVLAALQQLK